jgi:hypothetical protein
VWVARGLVLSGCPLFPSTIGCVPLPWATPPSVGENVSAWIRSWARLPGASPDVVLASWEWLGPWAQAATRQPTLVVTGVLFAAGGLYHALHPRSAPREILAGWVAAIVGVAGWFLTAPTVRFGLGFLFAAALVPIAGSGLARKWAGTRAGRLALLVALGVLCAPIVTLSLRWTRHLTAASASWVSWPETPAGAVQPRRTASGLVVYVPRRGDQCWSAPLPCTPYFDLGLTYDGMFRTSTPNRRE